MMSHSYWRNHSFPSQPETLKSLIVCLQPPWGGTDLERRYGDVRPWRSPFHTSPVVRKGPISSKRVSLQDPFWENLEILASTASIFTQIWAHKPPNLEIFSSQAPKFGNFQFTSPPFQRQISVRNPHTSEIRAAHPYLKKKLSVSPPPPGVPATFLKRQQETAEGQKSLTCSSTKSFFFGGGHLASSCFATNLATAPSHSVPPPLTPLLPYICSHVLWRGS